MDTPLSILVAEDELGDAFLLQRAFRKAGVQCPVHFARDGQEVIDYLSGVPPFENPIEFPLPSLLLLDLKLPKLSGFEVLGWVRQRQRLSRMLVVVFSASDRPEDVERARALGVSAYIVKPNDPDELIHIVRRIQNYWLGITASTQPLPVLTAA